MSLTVQAGELKLSKAHLGISDNTVAPGRREERKSVGVERTFRDKTDSDDIMATLVEIAEELHKDLENLQYAGKTVTVKYKLHTFESEHLRQKAPGPWLMPFCRQDSRPLGQKVHFHKGRDPTCEPALLIDDSTGEIPSADGRDCARLA